MEGFTQQAEQGNRFEFGRNWRSFLSTVDERRIVEAEKSLKQMLEVDDLTEKSFLDAGSKILVEGEYHADGIFRASQLIMKCPSKYESVIE